MSPERRLRTAVLYPPSPESVVPSEGLPRFESSATGNSVGMRKPDAEEVEQTFRDANRTIADVAVELGAGSRVPFLCECSDPSCHAIIRMPWAEFDAVHRDGNLFVVAPGHELLEAEELVAETQHYNIVEK